MKRLAITATVAVLAPLAAWGAASAVPDGSVDCATAAAPLPAECRSEAPITTEAPSTTAPPTTAAPTTAPPTTAAAPTTAPPTTAPPTTSAPATTVVPAPTTPPPTSPPAPTTTTTTTTLPSVTAPPATTAPGTPSTTTPTTTVAPTTTVPAPTTTVVTPPEDVDSQPVAPPTESESGRIVVPDGAVDTGQVRPIVFPVAGPSSYVDDFGACRDGCRRAHKGNDIIGDRLQPLLAMRDGVVDRLLDHPTAGLGVVIRDAEGWEYHIYHLNNDTPGTDDGRDDGTWGLAPGVVPGARVTAGQLIGWMGDSGNSEGSVPHAHVEVHRPDGVAINPYWSLRRAQRDANCTVAEYVVDPLDADPEWLAEGWAAAQLPGGWAPLALTGGRPNSGATAARMWVHPSGFTPVDAASLLVGDGRYDAGVDCNAAPDPAPPAMPAELGAVLAAIRTLESGGDYAAQARTSTASGAYQFVDSTWGGYGGFARAKDAPPEIQDAKAIEHAVAILARNGGDVTTVPVSWYIGHVPVGAEWDSIPAYPGNVLTPRQYQDRWMTRYAQLLGTPEAWVGGASSWTPVDRSATCHTVVVDVGTPGQPEYLLTRAQTFFATTTGMALASPVDPCDPGRPLPAPVEDGLADIRRSGPY